MAPPDCPRRQTHQDILDNDLSLELRRSKEGKLDVMGKRPPMEFASRNLVAEIEEAQLKLRMAEQSFAASTSDLQDCEHQLKLINAKRAEEVCEYHNAEAFPLAAFHELRHREAIMKQAQLMHAKLMNEEQVIAQRQREAAQMIEYLTYHLRLMKLDAEEMDVHRRAEQMYEFRPWQRQQDERRAVAEQRIFDVERRLGDWQRHSVEVARARTFNQESQRESEQHLKRMQESLAEGQNAAQVFGKWFAFTHQAEKLTLEQFANAKAGAEHAVQLAQQRAQREAEAVERIRSLEAKLQDILATQQHPLVSFGCW